MTSLGKNPNTTSITTDASGNWGCGAYSSGNHWFQCEWLGSWAQVHITAKELLPIVIACAVWGQAWQGKTVMCYCDNAAVVAVIRSGRSRHTLTMHLMRCLSLLTAHLGITPVAEHLLGKHNVADDAIARGNLPLFLEQIRGAARIPTPIPPSLQRGHI